MGHSIGMLSNQIRRRLDTFSVKNSMSGAQGRVLHFILAQPGDVFQKDIEEEFCLYKGSTEISFSEALKDRKKKE